MIVDLPFDSTSDHYKTRVDLADPSDPKTQYLVAGLKTEAIQRLIIMHAQSDEALRQGIVVSPSVRRRCGRSLREGPRLPGRHGRDRETAVSGHAVVHPALGHVQSL